MLFRRQARPIDLLTWVQSTNVNLLGGGTAPFAQFDWPNPRGKLFPVELRTFLNPAEIQLIGKDTFFAGAGIGPDYDWTNPVLRKSWFSAITSQPIPNWQPLIAAKPFNQSDWPVPKGKAFPSDLRTFTNAAEIHLIGQDVFYAGAGIGPDFDFPNPAPRKSATATIEAQPVPNLQGTTLLVTANPFYQTDFPNPLPKRFPQELRTFTKSTPVNLTGKDVFFGAAGMAPDFDWNMPTRAKPRQQIDQPTNMQPLLAAFPVGQSEQTNPARRKAIDVQQPVNLLENTLTTTVAPFTQNAWPNPQQRVRPDNFAAGAGALQTLISAMPVGRSDGFPNPVKAKTRQQSEQLATILPLTALPIGVQEQQQPRGKPAVVSDQFANTLLSLSTPPVVTRHEWPNPVRRKSSHAVDAQPVMNLLRTTLKPVGGGGLLMLRRRHVAR